MKSRLENRERNIARMLRQAKAVRRHVDIDQRFPVRPMSDSQLVSKIFGYAPAGSKAKDAHEDKDIGALSQRQHDLERRVGKLERILNVQTFADIEERIKTTFSNTTIIEKIYGKIEHSSLLLVIVYNSKTISDAIIQIQPGLVRLEDEFPDMYLDPCLLHVNEVHEGHLQESKLIVEY